MSIALLLRRIIYHSMLSKLGQFSSLHWRHNGRDGFSNHQPHIRLVNRLFRRRSKKTSKLRVTGLCVESSPVTDEFPAHMASNAGNVSILWRHHVLRVIQWAKKPIVPFIIRWTIYFHKFLWIVTHHCGLMTTQGVIELEHHGFR